MIVFKNKQPLDLRPACGHLPLLKKLAICLSLLFLLTVPVESPSFPSIQDVLSCEIDLCQWGLKEPSDIGYISAGVLHKKSGEELVIYDIRKRKPEIQEPAKPEGRIPFFRGEAFLIDDFQRGNTNRLGGYFSRLVRAPSESQLKIEGSPDGQRFLCFTYEQKSPGWAGFWIHAYDFKSPPLQRVFLDTSPFEYLTFDIRGEEGGEKLTLQVADYSWELKEDSLEVGDVGQFLPEEKILPSWQRAWIPIRQFPPSIDRKTLASLVFLARSGKGRVYIDNIGFTTRKDVPPPLYREQKIQKHPLHRGMWVWKTKDLLEDPEKQAELVRFSQEDGISEIFLQLPYDVQEEDGKSVIIWDRSGIAGLLSSFHRAGIKVHALDGDPRFALREWHSHIIATIRSIVQYNRSVRRDECFDGIRYDNEPYLLPYFAGVQKESFMEQYLESLRIAKDLVGSAGLEFGVDIPFWFDEKNDFFEPITRYRGRFLSEWVLDIVDNIGIMDYRTEAFGADGIIAHAWGELLYASKKGKKVFIGLETSEVPDETILEFGPSPGPSQVRLEKREGTKILLQWFRNGFDAKTSRGSLLSQQKETFVPSGKLSFFQKNGEVLDEVMEAAESEFQKYPAFHGFALHYYESYRRLKQNPKKD